MTSAADAKVWLWTCTNKHKLAQLCVENHCLGTQFIILAASLLLMMLCSCTINRAHHITPMLHVQPRRMPGDLICFMLVAGLCKRTIELYNYIIGSVITLPIVLCHPQNREDPVQIVEQFALPVPMPHRGHKTCPMDDNL